MNSHLLFPDQGSPFGQDTLEDCQQASPCYRGSYGAGAPSPGSSDVSTPGEHPHLGRRLPFPQVALSLGFPAPEPRPSGRSWTWLDSVSSEPQQWARLTGVGWWGTDSRPRCL